MCLYTLLSSSNEKNLKYYNNYCSLRICILAGVHCLRFDWHCFHLTVVLQSCALLNINTHTETARGIDISTRRTHCFFAISSRKEFPMHTHVGSENNYEKTTNKHERTMNAEKKTKKKKEQTLKSTGTKRTDDDNDAQ